MSSRHARKIKIDLHTHPIEALAERFKVKGVLDINREVAESIVEAITRAGLNGIAVTEHHNFNRGWVTALEINKLYPDEKLIILPGEEVDYKGQQFLRIFIPERIRRSCPFFKGKEWFLILAHPGFYNPFAPENFAHLEFDAVEEKSKHGDFQTADQIAGARKIPKIRTSDAHKLEDIGLYHMEFDFLPK